jgi:hypothetical protein
MGRFDCINIYVADVVEKAKALDIRQSNLAYHNSTICLLSFTLIQILKQVKDSLQRTRVHDTNINLTWKSCWTHVHVNKCKYH